MKNLFGNLADWFRAPGQSHLKTVLALFIPLLAVLGIGGLINRLDPSFTYERGLQELFPGDYVVIVIVGGFILWTWLRLLFPSWFNSHKRDQ